MRYAAKAAVLMGILLPTLETYRRGFAEWGVDFTTMFEDYWAGALLLAGAALYERRPDGPLLLLIVWGSVTGMILISLVSQIERTLRGGGLEPLNTEVLVVKLLLLAFSVSGLVSTFRDAGRRTAAHSHASTD